MAFCDASNGRARAANFAVLAGSTVTNVPDIGTMIYGDLGVSSVTAEFQPGIMDGTIFTGSAVSGRHVATRAQVGVTTESSDAAGRSTAPITVFGNPGGMMLDSRLYGRPMSSVETSSVTGFPPGIVNGTIWANEAVSDRNVATRAQIDLTTAYNDAAGRSTAPTTVSGNIGGMTLYPGLYQSTSSLEISAGDLTLDAHGDPRAVWIFQIASTLTTTSDRKVILAGGANASNIFWQIGSSATLGTNSVFRGTILANASITLDTGATLDGRALARSGAVSLDGNIVIAGLPRVKNISRLGYAVDALETGKLVYGDRDFVFEDLIPPFLNGQAYIRALNNEKALSNSDFLAFDVNMPVTVYVALDARMTPRPGWLLEWDRFSKPLWTTDAFGSMRVLYYSRSFPAGRVTLGPNSESGGLTYPSMYTVIIVPGLIGPNSAAEDWQLYY
jgi:hypothetical protein